MDRKGHSELGQNKSIAKSYGGHRAIRLYFYYQNFDILLLGVNIDIFWTLPRRTVVMNTVEKTFIFCTKVISYSVEVTREVLSNIAQIISSVLKVIINIPEFACCDPNGRTI